MTTGVATVRDLLEQVTDPEIPVLTIADLGILRDVILDEAGHVDVVITPTYSGCPAMDVIRHDIETVLNANGYTDTSVRMQLAPAWTTDWMSEGGRRKLKEFGIAPPSGRADGEPVLVQLTPLCPLCGSHDTRLVSRFGSTACKALHVCNACHEPFDHFKVI